MSAGFDAVGASRIGSIGAQVSVIERPTQRTKPSESQPQRRKPAILSKTTATYDRSGAYPALRLFQIAKQVPDSKPFGTLASDIPASGRRAFIAKLYGDAGEKSATFVDRLA